MKVATTVAAVSFGAALIAAYWVGSPAAPTSTMQQSPSLIKHSKAVDHALPRPQRQETNIAEQPKLASKTDVQVWALRQEEEPLLAENEAMKAVLTPGTKTLEAMILDHRQSVQSEEKQALKSPF